MSDRRKDGWSGALRRAFGTSPQAARAEDAPALGPAPGDLRRAMADARAGKPQAQKRVAAAYLRGEGVPPNPAEGVRWLEAAAQAGDGEAQASLATMLFRGLTAPPRSGAFGQAGVSADPARARTLAQQAAEAGESDGQALLGYLWSTGEGGPRDYERAAFYYG
jgi:TPR repeat protein